MNNVLRDTLGLVLLPALIIAFGFWLALAIFIAIVVKA